MAGRALDPTGGATLVRDDVTRVRLFDTGPVEAPPPLPPRARPSRDLPHTVTFAAGPAKSHALDLGPWTNTDASIRRFPVYPEGMHNPNLHPIRPTGPRCVPEPWDDPYELHS